MDIVHDSSVYLDINATTPLAPQVADVISNALYSSWINPSSLYLRGVQVTKAIQRARQQVADMISANDSKDIVFTSGGTEANNMVFNTMLHSVTTTDNSVQSRNPRTSPLPHFITSSIEHDSVANVVMRYLDRGLAEVSVVNVSPKTGAIEISEVLAAVKPNTSLISIMLANNETGVIQPIAELVKAIRYHTKISNMKKILVHTDAAQAIGKIRVDVNELGVDYLTIAGHKFYGPKIGALYVKNAQSVCIRGSSCACPVCLNPPKPHQTPIAPILLGGPQENGIRPGTENTPYIIGLGKAAELVTFNLTEYSSHMKEMREYLKQKLQDGFGTEVAFNLLDCSNLTLPNTLSIYFHHPDAKGAKVLGLCHSLEASVGAACHTSKGLSRVLLANGFTYQQAQNTIRLSVGRETSYNDIDQAVDDLHTALELVLDADTNIM